MSGVFFIESTYEEDVRFDPTLPPVFDEYGDEETIGVVQFSVTNLLNSSLIDYHEGECYKPPLDKPIDKKLYGLDNGSNIFFGCAFTMELRGDYNKFCKNKFSSIKLVHGGWWGGWHKEFLKFKGRNKMKSSIKWGSFLFTELLLMFVFDPGGLTLQELRSIPFQEGGDDTSKDTSILDEEVILAQSNLTCVLGTNVQAQAVSLLIVGGLDCGNMTLS